MPPKKSSKDIVEALSLPRSIEQKTAGTFLHIIGVDEAGCGPLAGPVVAAACWIRGGVSIDGVYDSKQTLECHREKTFDVLVNHPDVIWGVSVVSHLEIDKVNILQARMNAMTRATEMLLEKSLTKYNDKLKSAECIALIDGNRIPQDMPIESKFVIKGDGSIFSIAAASIIAKVTRDRIMIELDKEYPLYKLAQHKGYPTFEHRSLLHKHGPSDIHRMSYAPVRQAMLHHGGITVYSVKSEKTGILSKTKKIAVKTKDNMCTGEVKSTITADMNSYIRQTRSRKSVKVEVISSVVVEKSVRVTKKSKEIKSFPDVACIVVTNTTSTRKRKHSSEVPAVEKKTENVKNFDEFAYTETRRSTRVRK